MECRIPLNRRTLIVIIAFFLATVSVAEEGPREVVLVVGNQSPIKAVSSLELRKLYLGLPVVIDGVFARPLNNRSDELLQAIFFQSTMAMSEAAYERQLLSLSLRFGRLSPPMLDNADEIKRILRQDGRALSYTWRSDLSEKDGLRVVKLLWQEQ